MLIIISSYANNLETNVDHLEVFWFFFFILFVLFCLGVGLCTTCMKNTKKPGEGARFPGAGGTDGSELPHWCCESHLGPLQSGQCSWLLSQLFRHLFGLSISETKSLYVWLSLMSGFELIHRALPASEMASTFFFFNLNLLMLLKN